MSPDVKDAAIVGAVLLGGLLVVRALQKGDAAAVAPATPPAGPLVSPAAPGPLAADFPRELLGGTSVFAQPGHTYFAVIETHGVVFFAANPDRIKARAEAEGFRDVVVFTQRPSNWPGTITGEYFVRATFVGASVKEFQRKAAAGGVVLLDVWESA